MGSTAKCGDSCPAGTLTVLVILSLHTGGAAQQQHQGQSRKPECPHGLQVRYELRDESLPAARAVALQRLLSAAA